MAESKHISIGRVGEDVAAEYLYRRGWVMVSRNYRKAWGELDIVAIYKGTLHFVEVKTGSWHGPWPKEGDTRHRPEDHMHKAKCARMARAIQSFLLEHGEFASMPWTADLCTILLREEDKRARVALTYDILLTP